MILIWGIIGASCLVLGLILISTRNPSIFAIFLSLGGISLLCCLLSFFHVHVTGREKNGYMATVYAGWFARILYVEDKRAVCTFSRNLYGNLPDSTEVYSEVTFFTNSIKLGFGNDGDTKHLI